MERLEEDMRVDNETEKTKEMQREETEVGTLDSGIGERREDVERMWARGTAGLVELGKMPGALAKLERAQRAVKVVEDM